MTTPSTTTTAIIPCELEVYKKKMERDVAEARKFIASTLMDSYDPESRCATILYDKHMPNAVLKEMETSGWYSASEYVFGSRKRWWFCSTREAAKQKAK